MTALSDGFFAGPITTTPANFGLAGGKYMFTAVATAWNGGTATLNRIGPDGVTLLSVGSAAVLNSNGGAVLDLPPGQYQLTLSGSAPTALYAEVLQIPYSTQNGI